MIKRFERQQKLEQMAAIGHAAVRLRRAEVILGLLSPDNEKLWTTAFTRANERRDELDRLIIESGESQLTAHSRKNTGGKT